MLRVFVRDFKGEMYLYRVKYYTNYHIGKSNNTTSGYAIEECINNEWINVMFMELKDGEFIHASFLQFVGMLQSQNQNIIWDIF